MPFAFRLLQEKAQQDLRRYRKNVRRTIEFNLLRIGRRHAVQIERDRE